MYLYYLDKGIDLSKPHYMSELNEYYERYYAETGLAPAILSRQPQRRPEAKKKTLIANENIAFSGQNDVFPLEHARYQPVPIHMHEYCEIMCIIRGSCTIYFGSHPVSMETGDVIVIPPYIEHCNSVFNDDCILYNHEIRFSTIRNKFSCLFASRHLISELFLRSFDPDSEPCFLVFHAGDYFQGDNKFADILEEYNSRSDFSFEVLNILTAAFLFDLLRRFSETATMTTIQDRKSQIDVLLTDYIAEHADTVTLAELSRKFSYSDRYIAQIIKKNTGLAYSQYVKKVKMETIAKMIEGSSLPIEKIIEISGASSSSYFYKIFKSYFGKTPLEYRNERLAVGGDAYLFAERI
jgi:AraC-like DNA-binding protein/mannose-6-phosphate isomerase-like protein (cupin superfamily)